MQVNNNIINTFAYNQQIQQIANYAEDIKWRRQQRFFSNIKLTNKANYHTPKTHDNISNETFYDKIITASFAEIKETLAEKITELTELDKFYCNAMHSKELNIFLTRVKNQAETNEGVLKNDLIDTLYNLYNLNSILKQLKHQFECEQQSTAITSKQAINLRLDECLGNLDKCWPGVSSRLAYEYEALNTLTQGLSGKIYLIKKDLFKEFASNYINEKKADNPDFFFIGNEIHLFNALTNLVADILGLNKISDKYEQKQIDAKIVEEFIVYFFC